MKLMNAANRHAGRNSVEEPAPTPLPGAETGLRALLVVEAGNPPFEAAEFLKRMLPEGSRVQDTERQAVRVPGRRPVAQPGGAPSGLPRPRPRRPPDHPADPGECRRPDQHQAAFRFCAGRDPRRGLRLGGRHHSRRPLQRSRAVVPGKCCGQPAEAFGRTGARRSATEPGSPGSGVQADAGVRTSTGGAEPHLTSGTAEPRTETPQSRE